MKEKLSKISSILIFLFAILLWIIAIGTNDIECLFIGLAFALISTLLPLYNDL